MNFKSSPTTCALILGAMAMGVSAEVNIDGATVYNGELDPNNVLIHVTQNFANFVSSSLFWLAAIGMVGPTFNSGNGKSYEPFAPDRWAYGPNFHEARRHKRAAPAPTFRLEDVNFDKVARMLRAAADGAETMKA